MGVNKFIIKNSPFIARNITLKRIFEILLRQATTDMRKSVQN
jgi:hypothetical protein